MGIPVKLEVFEGPLDLLLHLIDKNKIDIYDIPIVEITEQYMNYIHTMEQTNLDIVSEFLVMAATLLNIKSKMLLPKEEKVQEEERDPRTELVERLLEYKMYQYISYELKEKQIEAEKMIFRKTSLPKEIADYKEEINVNELLSGLSLCKLQTIFHSVMKRQEDKIDPIRSKFNKVEKEEVNLVQKIEDIQAFGRKHKQFSFPMLLTHQKGKMNLIVTFLGVLELMKIGKIQIIQRSLFDEILIIYTDQTNRFKNDFLITEYQ